MDKIYITKSFTAPLSEYVNELNDIWNSSIFSNNGQKVQEFTFQLEKQFSLNNVLLMSNGTLPIQIALKSILLKNKQEIITTPFSYIATTSSILWENGTPVFVDIDENNLTINENLIEEKITPRTAGILATHVYGNPCNVEKIDAIAKQYSLPVIYDGAHAVGVKYQNKSLLSYGDIATTSFHATKILHTGEGGMAVVNNPIFKDSIMQMMNFGHSSPTSFSCVGINAKMNELSAALGICNLRYLAENIQGRKSNFSVYDEKLSFKNYSKFEFRKNTEPNYSYYPIIFESEKALKQVKDQLERNQIVPRRYFYPSLSTLNFLDKTNATPISDSISERVLCLPVSTHYSKQIIETICEKINQA